jgi:uncharacterized membrane protein YedE/YeeE
VIPAKTLIMGGFGLALGFSLSCIGFTEWGEVHRMFTFSDLRMLFAFGGAVTLTAIGFALSGRARELGSRPVHRGTVAGGVIFGLGWAICGACPGASLAQLGEGQLLALVTIAGIVVGARLHAALRSRLFTWDHGSCET